MERNREKIVGLQIPDNDLPNWMRELNEIGMSQEEIDRFFGRLNKTYRDSLYHKEKETLKGELIRFFQARNLRASEESLENIIDDFIRFKIEQGREIKNKI